MSENESTEAREGIISLDYGNGLATKNVIITQNGVVAKHTVTWSVNGTTTEEVYYDGDDIDFAAPSVTLPTGYTFVGWAKATLDEAQDEKPTLVDEATATEDATYYAVFAQYSGAPGSLTKLDKDATFATGDNIVVVAKGTSYAMYQETANTSYVANYTFDGKLETVAADNKKWWTLTSDGSDGWYLGDATIGYLYNSSSNNLTASNKSDCSSFTIAWNSANSAFILKTNSRYLACRTDLNGDNQNLYRMASGTSNGVPYFDLYKYVAASIAYSGYCTTIALPETLTATVTSAGWGTYAPEYAVQFRTGTKAYIVEVADDSEAVLTLVESVPAGTAVLLKGEGEHTMDVVESSKTDVKDNCLKVSDGTAKDNIYVLADGNNGVGFYLWTGTALSSGKVYLQPNISSSRLFFRLPGGETTEVSSIGIQQPATVYFDLQGRRAANPAKGLYLVNGKKTIIK